MTEQCRCDDCEEEFPQEAIRPYVSAPPCDSSVVFYFCAECGEKKIHFKEVL